MGEEHSQTLGGTIVRILLACPGFQNPTCGIGRYATEFFHTLKLLGHETIGYSGPLIGIYHHVLERRPDVTHIQFEYGWASWERLKILCEQCSPYTKMVITFHSVNPTAPHNYHVGQSEFRVVVHESSQMKFFGQQQVRHIPLAITSVNPDPSAITAPREKGVMRVGWFGNVFFHKGLHTLFQEPWNAPVELLILGGEPPHSKEYYHRCRERAKSVPYRVLWYNKYMADAAVVAHLGTCDAIIFPYEEYGGTGCSAALRLAFNAERMCFVSDTSHFKDVTSLDPRPVGFLNSEDWKLVRPDLRAANALRSDWSFPAIVQRHVDEVYS